METVFEAKTIQQPLASAPKQPNRNEADYISIYSDKYTNVAGTNFNPDWGQSGQGSSYAEFDLDGDKMLQYIKLSYQGIGIGETIDVSPEDAANLAVRDSEVVRVSSLRGSLEVPVRIDQNLRPGLVFMTMHFPDQVNTNLITIDATDPKSGTAEFKAAAVRIDRINERVPVAGE